MYFLSNIPLFRRNILHPYSVYKTNKQIFPGYWQFSNRLYDVTFHYSSQNVIILIKSGNVNYAGRVARILNIGNTCETRKISKGDNIGRT